MYKWSGMGGKFFFFKNYYVAMIRSVFDYGCVVYGSASKNMLGKLCKIQAQAMRQCCGAVKTTAISALQVLVGEMPLEIRRKQLMINYWANLQGHKDEHPTKVVLKNCWEQNVRCRTSFGWCSKIYAEELQVNNIKMSPTVEIQDYEPWVYITPHIDLHLLEVKRTEREVDFRYAFSEYIRAQYPRHIQVYTDGSKDSEHQTTGAAFLVKVASNQWISGVKRTSNYLAVYTVKLIGILLALQWVEEIKPDNVLICTDSVSVLKTLRSFKSSHQDIIFNILHIHSRIVQNGISISFMWIPAHIGIRGNEEVDTLAKQALQKDIIELQVPLSKSEMKVLIWSKLIEEWQVEWNNGTKGRFLFSILNKVNQNIKCISKSRKEEIIFSRILLGHSNLNSTLKIIGKHPNGLCEICKVEETVTHVFLDCRRYEQERRAMIEEIRKNVKQKINFEVLIKWASEINSKVFFDFIRKTGLVNRM